MKKLYLVDGNNFIYRMFFALPEFSTKDGIIVNAVFGMAKFFVNTLTKENPDYLIFIKDSKEKNFRHKIYTEYKATREKMPDNLITQIPLIEEVIQKMEIKIIEIAGFEADDVIGTLVTKLKKNSNLEIDILTADKDLHSLVCENVKIYDSLKKKLYGPKETKEKFGIPAEKIIDYLAIVGDSSDNIPGITGFGPSKAVELINNIGGIEEIFTEVEKIKNGEKTYENLPIAVQNCFKGKTFEKLIESRDIAILSKNLATIELDIPLKNFDLEDFAFKKENLMNNEVISLFEKYEFNSLIGENGSAKNVQYWKNLDLKVHIIDSKEKLKKLQEICLKEKQIVLDTETTSLDIMTAKLVGISIYLDDERIYYINRLHNGNKVSFEDLQVFVKQILNSNLLIIGHNLKYDLEILERFKNSTNQNYSNQSKKEIITEKVQTSLF